MEQWIWFWHAKNEQSIEECYRKGADNLQKKRPSNLMPLLTSSSGGEELCEDHADASGKVRPPRQKKAKGQPKT